MYKLKIKYIEYFALVVGVVFGCIMLAVPTYILWNILMPKYFNILEVTFLDALGFCILFRCLIPANGSK